MTSYEPLAYFHLIKFWNLHSSVTIFNFLWDFHHSVSLITGVSINRSLKKSFLKVHMTFKDSPVQNWLVRRQEEPTTVWHRPLSLSYWTNEVEAAFPSLPLVSPSYPMKIYGNWLTCMSRDMWFPTMWYVRPAKPQISLRIRAVWSEALLGDWIFYEC